MKLCNDNEDDDGLNSHYCHDLWSVNADVHVHVHHPSDRYYIC